MLAAEGMIRTSAGRYGGNVVTLPGGESMSEAIGLFVHGRRLPLHILHETREALEPFLARLAASRRTEDDLQEMTALHELLSTAVDDLREFSLTNVRWHNAVAKASGNELLCKRLLTATAVAG
ncbi:DNA-binding FadR family transcriptional regulator [Roseomonas pecuniae]|uniref:DNA-binding FadR family transcriptional regulator n=2 Tax=Muricoccus pecuniae TaxID=693023 RepID=A0A840YNI5_9PROT|nr:DNA-binding FadR family transcriptional regulator [Roseomonas pecuniae]